MTHTQNQGFTDDFTPIFDEVRRDFWTAQTVEDAHDELGFDETGEEIVKASSDFLRTAAVIVSIVIALIAIVVGLVIA